MSCRIAIVQHGDFREALRIVAAGGSEPYFGMAYSLDVLTRLLDGHQHLVISLDAPIYSEQRGDGELVGMPRPELPHWLPKTASMMMWAEQIRRRLQRFRPTHVLLRDGSTVARSVLELCRREGYGTLVMFANHMSSETPRLRWTNRRMVELLNEPFVYRVGNHKPPATESTVEMGLDPSKAIAWDWPNQRRPRDYQPKDFPEPPYEIIYAGALIQDKGPGDLIEAVKILSRQGMKLRLSIIGEGGQLPDLRKQAGELYGNLVRFEGRRGNQEVFHCMRRAALTCVPTRHAFAEGMPKTLTESLAARTPVMISDHPLFCRAYQEAEGVRFFPAADPLALAGLIRETLSNPPAYRRLSQTTASAYARVECSTRFGDLIDQWAETFQAAQTAY